MKYGDVVSGGENLTMIVRLTEGVGTNICVPFLIFKNIDHFCPIRGILDTVAGIYYRTGLKVWMD